MSNKSEMSDMARQPIGGPLSDLTYLQREVSDLARESVRRNLELAKIEAMVAHFRMSTTQLLGGKEWKT